MCYDKEYAARLESYIQSENFTRTLYRELASKCRGETSAILRRMGDEEARHLKSMQMEYYLLTGDTLPIGRPDIEGSLQENLRRAYSGEWDAAESYAREAERCADPRLKKLYLTQSEDELRHRRMVNAIVSRLFGG